MQATEIADILAPETFEQAQGVRRTTYVLPTKNRWDRMEKAYRRTLKLLGDNDELIVISGSDSPEPLEWHERVRFIWEQDRSQTHAFNKGFMLARGRYVKLATDDDVLYREGLETCYAHMDADPELAVVVGGGWKYNEVHGRSTVICLPASSRFGRTSQSVLTYGATGIGSIYRRSAFAAVGLWALPWIVADVEFVARCAEFGLKVRFCRAHVYDHYLQAHSALEAQRARCMAEIKALRELYRVPNGVSAGWPDMSPEWDGALA